MTALRIILILVFWAAVALMIGLAGAGLRLEGLWKWVFNLGALAVLLAISIFIYWRKQ